MKKKLSFILNIDSDLKAGAERILSLLGVGLGGGIGVSAELSGKNGVILKDGHATVYYTQKAFFFRQLGILVKNAEKSDGFELFEDSFFTTVSTMIDASRCAVPTISTLKRLIDRLALMGYNLAMLYTEDTVKLEGRPYFGYMRGAYTKEELMEIDDYAFGYGIEIIPCLECYGHMEKYLAWGEASAIKDTEKVLMAREEKTFQFLDELIGAVSSCFRSKRIHIGMDEAWGMGRGKFMDKHGYVDPFEIFSEYMERLISITNKYGLKPMMWSDMYFRNGSPTHQYYDAETEVPESIASKIPKEVQLVFWHYGEKHECDDYMLKKHVALGRDVIFAGGLWSWTGHFPEHRYALETSRFSLNACRNNGVREAMATIWSNDNAECDLFVNLYGLSFFAELCFDRDADDAKLARRFEEISGGCAEAFLDMGSYHNDFDNVTYSKYQDRFLGKPLFWQDIMEGFYDFYLFERPMSGHYAAYAQKMKGFSGGEWDYLYRFAEDVFDYMAAKCLIAENLVPAYKDRDKEKLGEIARVLLPALKEKLIRVHLAHREMWLDKLKVQGWSSLDCRYGGMEARCDTAIMTLERYLAGECESLPELEEPRLKKPMNAFIRYSGISTPLGVVVS
jgi:hypothetical protein